MNPTQRKGSVIINESNVRTNILIKHCGMLHSNSMWHKLFVHNIENLDKKIVLKAIMDAVFPNDFIPVNYLSEQTSSSFLIKNCPGAIKQICSQYLMVQNPSNPNKPFKFSIVLGYASAQEMKVNIEDKISAVTKKRFNSETKVLNLEAFYKDPELEEFCPLSQPKIMLFVLHMCKHLPYTTLKLCNNEIRILEALEPLTNHKHQICLDLRHNLIEDPDYLYILKGIPITELHLEGNPICDKMDETAYLKLIRECSPNTKKLDGIWIWNVFQLFRRNYLCNNMGKDLVDQFLEHFFTLYDAADRNPLKALYHPNGLLSVTSNYLSGQISSISARLSSYKQYSRNIKFMSNLSKCDEYVHKGPKKILEVLSSFPKSEHDPYSFTVDLMYYANSVAIFVVTGVFREPADSLADTERFLGFTRTFVLQPGAHNQYYISNDELHISNATTAQQNSAFKHVRVLNANKIFIPTPTEDKEKHELALTLKRISTLNLEWAKRCLEDTNYDLKKALTLFVDLFKVNKLPDEAFVYKLDEDIFINLTDLKKEQPEEGRLNDIPMDLPQVVSPRKQEVKRVPQQEKAIVPNEILGATTTAEIHEVPMNSVLKNRSRQSMLMNKNLYYTSQLKNMMIAKRKGDLAMEKQIIIAMMELYPEDSIGYKELQRFLFENEEVASARSILSSAKEKLQRKKFLTVIHHYCTLEMKHGCPKYLIGYIENQISEYHFSEYIVDYLKALLACGEKDRAREAVQSKAKVIKKDTKLFKQIKELEIKESFRMF